MEAVVKELRQLTKAVVVDGTAVLMAERGRVPTAVVALVSLLMAIMQLQAAAATVPLVAYFSGILLDLMEAAVAAAVHQPALVVVVAAGREREEVPCLRIPELTVLAAEAAVDELLATQQQRVVLALLLFVIFVAQ
jgi:hypothetical protein